MALSGVYPEGVEAKLEGEPRARQWRGPLGGDRAGGGLDHDLDAPPLGHRECVLQAAHL